MSNPPHILLILCDDMGYSDLGCYGGEVDTPHIDGLAAQGLRFTHFYNTPRCSPSRACLLTGLHPHEVGVGILTGHDFEGDYPGELNSRCATIPEVLKPRGYRSYISGKWHLSNALDKSNGSWPLDRGFDHFYGIVHGGCSYYWPGTLVRDNENIEHEAEQDPDYYFTDAISDAAVGFINEHFIDHADKPFFQYLSYTAPHWPLHAPVSDIEKYKGRYDEGWDVLRKKRFERMKAMGLLGADCQLSSRDPSVPAWNTLSDDEKAWQLRRMETYAAQIECMDRGIGRVLKALRDRNQLDNTMVVFLSDNGGAAEELPHLDISGGAPLFAKSKTRDGRAVNFGNDASMLPGAEDSYQTYGAGWANVSNTPFRLYKHWTHEGGISSPCIIHWPKGFDAEDDFRHDYAYLPDIMASILDATGSEYPDKTDEGEPMPQPKGESLIPVFQGNTLDERYQFWEHEGNAAVRQGDWKLVKNFANAHAGAMPYGPERGAWELYNTAEDRTEMANLVDQYPDRVQRMRNAWEQWAVRVGVIPREQWLADQAK